MLKHARIKLFYRFLRPYQARTRRLRGRIFAEKMNVREGMRVVDLGGSTQIWQWVPTPLDITLVNLTYDPGVSPVSDAASHHRFHYIIGDACDVKLPSNSFDLVYSNSVIEHVGNQQKQQAFANEVHRLAPRFWIQTPSKWFPLEAHSGMPLWWFYPESWRQYCLKKWRPELPMWTEMVETTSLVERAALQHLFPDATILAERSLGIVKSHVAFKT